jgi:N-acyl-D-amino-acid deacylase
VFDVLIAGGDVYDGSGAGPVTADVGVSGDRVAAVGPGLPREAGIVVDAAGKAVCPGFINILSHSHLTILHDPRSLGELTQGVTTEVFGEGVSMGPLTPPLKAELESRSRGLDVEVSWTRLSEYLRHVERRGAAQNVASFIGAGTLRAGAVGYDDRPATPGELDLMRQVTAEEMADGALGIASALVYPPGSYAGTSELVSLCEVAAAYDGCYASHVRGEGEQLHAALGEFLRIVGAAGLRGEVFHLKALRPSWHLMDGAISLIEEARSAGLPVTADVYPYTAGSSALTSMIPDRFHEGGAAALYGRLGDPEVRAAIRAELSASPRWGDPAEAENVLILRVAAEENRKWQGRTLAEIAAARGTGPVDTAMDLIASDRSRIQAAFFAMSEDNLRAALRRPWVAISSDSTSMAPAGAFLRAPVHPRAYGSFARVLRRYVRDEKVLPLADAIRRMTGLPAATLGLSGRGVLRAGGYADIVVFDPATVADHATFADPHRLSTGVSEVLVNGKVAISGGTFTGELAGRALAGPGAR